jgi:hypothetical protein
MTTRTNENETPQYFNGYEDMIREMNNQDNAGGMDEEAFDEVQYAAISNMYIKDVTRDGYQGSNKRLLLWLNKNSLHVLVPMQKGVFKTLLRLK